MFHQFSELVNGCIINSPYFDMADSSSSAIIWPYNPLTVS